MAEKDKDTDLVDKEAQIPSNIPVLPVRDIVVFPYMIIPLFVGREISIKAIEHALSSSRMILLLTQKDLSIENPLSSDLYNIGTVGMIIRMLKLPDGRVKVLVQGLSKAKVTHFTQADPFITADIVSQSLIASSSLFKTTTPDPSPNKVPSASLSNGLQWPSGENIPPGSNMYPSA